MAGVKTGEVPGKTKLQKVLEGFPETKDLNNSDNYVGILCINVCANVLCYVYMYYVLIHTDLHLRGGK